MPSEVCQVEDIDSPLLPRLATLSLLASTAVVASRLRSALHEQPHRLRAGELPPLVRSSLTGSHLWGSESHGASC